MPKDRGFAYGGYGSQRTNPYGGSYGSSYGSGSSYGGGSSYGSSGSRQSSTRSSFGYSGGDDLGYSKSYGSSGKGTFAGTFNSAKANTKPVQTNNTDTDKFHSGVKVLHKKFGEGVIVETKQNGDDKVAVIAFKGIGIKTLVVRLAPIEVIE
jgi:DNA helicase-2/ATP-dependent DNA helicase PcrA